MKDTFLQKEENIINITNNEAKYIRLSQDKSFYFILYINSDSETPWKNAKIGKLINGKASTDFLEKECASILVYAIRNAQENHNLKSFISDWPTGLGGVARPYYYDQINCFLEKFGNLFERKRGKGVCWVGSTEFDLDVPNNQDLEDKDSKKQNLISPEVLVYTLFDNPDDFLFSDEKQEQMIWNKISNMFFRGIPIDSTLEKALASPEIKYINAEVRCALLYSYGRLLYKRGKAKSGEEAFQKVRSLFGDISSTSRCKVQSLIDGRLLIESDFFARKPEKIRFAGCKIASIPCASDEYIAHETASIYGKGVINLFLAVKNFTKCESSDILNIYREMVNLYNRYPTILSKQDLFITTMEWCIGLWSVDSSLFDSYESTISKGFLQSKLGKNDLFHITCLLAYGIYLVKNENKVNAMIIFLLCCMLMKSINLRVDHEGISQLLVYLKEYYPNYYLTFQTMYNYCNQDKVLIEKMSKLGVYSFDGTWSFIVDYSSHIYKDLYAHLFHQGSKKIYEVSFDDVKFRLEN